MEKRTSESSVKGVIITDGKTLDIRLPKNVSEIFKGTPRLILKRVEWYGIHPLPMELLSRELQGMGKDYMFIAVPKEMMR
ncbi:MAG: hypothetical protein KAV87_41900 [Desulfobacteraceae bacterium]|nr:hypothetical protein [Desulfobacteraceae bacterium]